MRIRDLAAARVRYGYRRITVLLKREGWSVGKKRVYRIYKAEGLEVRTKKRKKPLQESVCPKPLPSIMVPKGSKAVREIRLIKKNDIFFIN